MYPSIAAYRTTPSVLTKLPACHYARLPSCVNSYGRLARLCHSVTGHSALISTVGLSWFGVLSLCLTAFPVAVEGSWVVCEAGGMQCTYPFIGEHTSELVGSIRCSRSCSTAGTT